jgi:hypothetical protein
MFQPPSKKQKQNTLAKAAASSECMAGIVARHCPQYGIDRQPFPRMFGASGNV